MARSTTSSSHSEPESTATLVEGARNAATAEVDAEVQTHHRLLLCLEQSRRAQEKMAHDWMHDMLGAARTLASSTDQRKWLQAPAALACAMCASALTAQGTALAAWSEYQRSVLDQARASNGFSTGGEWPYARKAVANATPVPDAAAEATWMNDAMKTYDRFATAWTSAWRPDGLPAQH